MTFGEKLFIALGNARTQNSGVLTRDQWIAKADEVAHAEGVTKKRKPKGAARARNPLFDALAESMSTGNTAKLTRNAAKAVGVALADIIDVSPDVTPEEIRRIAAAYKRRWTDPRNWSPMALSKHWHEFCVSPTEKTRAALADLVYVTPKFDWKKIVAALYPGTPFVEQLPDKSWADCPLDVRREVLSEFERSRHE